MERHLIHMILALALIACGGADFGTAAPGAAGAAGTTGVGGAGAHASATGGASGSAGIPQGGSAGAAGVPDVGTGGTAGAPATGGAGGGTVADSGSDACIPPDGAPACVDQEPIACGSTTCYLDHQWSNGQWYGGCYWNGGTYACSPVGTNNFQITCDMRTALCPGTQVCCMKLSTSSSHADGIECSSDCAPSTTQRPLCDPQLPPSMRCPLGGSCVPAGALAAGYYICGG